MLQPPTPDEIRAFIKTHGLTQPRFAESLGVSLKTVEAWLAGTNIPPFYLGFALVELGRQLKKRK